MRNLRDLTYEDLLAVAESMGEKPYRAGQVYSWVFKRGVRDIDSMTDLSKELRERLKEGFFIGGLTVKDVKTSSDGTKKFLCLLADGRSVETVIIPEEKRTTLCVSSQTGCALGCAFCLTARLGHARDLALSELTCQVFCAREVEKERDITNVVLMGMGEPLLNYENVLKFTGVLTDSRAFGFSHNRVTVSTSGVVPGIKRLAQDTNVNLAVSLNAATDEKRDALMPVNRKYPLEELIKALRDYPLKAKKVVTIEYVLLKDVNDTDEDARRLARLLKGLRCKINLIPFNPFPGTTFKRPPEERVLAFGDILRKANYTVVIRASKGGDISAACGQLGGLEGNFL